MARAKKTTAAKKTTTASRATGAPAPHRELALAGGSTYVASAPPAPYVPAFLTSESPNHIALGNISAVGILSNELNVPGDGVRLFLAYFDQFTEFLSVLLSVSRWRRHHYLLRVHTWPVHDVSQIAVR